MAIFFASYSRKRVFPSSMTLARINPNPHFGAREGPGKAPASCGNGTLGIYALKGSAILVNLSVASRFDYRTLFRLTALAIHAGGALEICNQDIAIFAFQGNGIIAFMEGVGSESRITRTLVSPKEHGCSKVNVRFAAGFKNGKTLPESPQ